MVLGLRPAIESALAMVHGPQQDSVHRGDHVVVLAAALRLDESQDVRVIVVTAEEVLP